METEEEVGMREAIKEMKILVSNYEALNSKSVGINYDERILGINRMIAAARDKASPRYRLVNLSNAWSQGKVISVATGLDIVFLRNIAVDMKKESHHLIIINNKTVIEPIQVD